MKTKRFNRLFIFCLSLVVILVTGVKDGLSAPVDAGEAISVADLWFAMELNSGYIKIDSKERAGRFDRMKKRQVFYMVSKDDLLDSQPSEGDVLAYVVKYEPTGYVVVSGDDRIEPIVVFDFVSTFRWDQPEVNFLRYFLGTEMPSRKGCVEEKATRGDSVDIHPNWLILRAKLKERKSLQEVTFEVPNETVRQTDFVLWETPTWDQGTNYNETVIANNGNTPGIPTGCVATAMAIKMRFHASPTSGRDQHDYCDDEGSVQFCHDVDYSAQSYNFANMPMTSLSAPNADVGDLMYHAGVSVDMNYEAVGGSGADTSDVDDAMNDHFWYACSVDTDDDYDAAKLSVLGGLPVILGGHGHAVVADGWRSSGHFHINVGYNGNCNGWYSLSNVPNNPGCSTEAITISIPFSSPWNYRYVDSNDGCFFFCGCIQEPIDNFADGYDATPQNGHLWLKGGEGQGYSVNFSLMKPMTIRAYNGPVSIVAGAL